MSNNDSSASELISSPKENAGDHSIFPESSAWSSSFLDRSHPTSPRRLQSSPRSIASGVLRSHWLPSYPVNFQYCGLGSILSSLLSSCERSEKGIRMSQSQGVKRRKSSGWWGRQLRRNQWIVLLVGLVGFFFMVNWWMFFRLQNDPSGRRKNSDVILNSTLSAFPRQRFTERKNKYAKVGRFRPIMYNRLFALAAHSLADAEGKPEPRDLWKETVVPTVSWRPCADQGSWKPSEATNGFVLVSANGGISQQRVAICNAVAIARLLNSTLVIPRFLYSNVWQDTSQFGDIYQEEYFINYLQADIKIVKDLPVELQSLDLEAIGSLITDAEIMKEAKPSFYVKKILPILLKNRLVHFTGFGNRLAFDPIPFDLQRLRCRCNFHALRFVDKIQETGALLVQRMRRHMINWSFLEHNLLGPSAAKSNHNASALHHTKASRYLAIHLRFEIDMAAYSLCYFGGGKEEEEELEAYREVHFPALNELRKTKKYEECLLQTTCGLKVSVLSRQKNQYLCLLLLVLSVKQSCMLLVLIFMAGSREWPL
ncbi:uncharacterized protein LOC110025761 isoform X2 [Phalaenopsis equestris]|uniref:uncharacterized protein LOC110025761 isoform X2 n=1 Tax=Phalaenopsis equestris TaxID=78828 RepID=UPI0009E2E9FC|nr:uncharacterized protein LOC110025761 isoform X2 [Phalaenopsis equestris]